MLRSSSRCPSVVRLRLSRPCALDLCVIGWTILQQQSHSTVYVILFYASFFNLFCLFYISFCLVACVASDILVCLFDLLKNSGHENLSRDNIKLLITSRLNRINLSGLYSVDLIIDAIIASKPVFKNTFFFLFFFFSIY